MGPSSGGKHAHHHCLGIDWQAKIFSEENTTAGGFTVGKSECIPHRRLYRCPACNNRQTPRKTKAPPLIKQRSGQQQQKHVLEPLVLFPASRIVRSTSSAKTTVFDSGRPFVVRRQLLTCPANWFMLICFWFLLLFFPLPNTNIVSLNRQNLDPQQQKQQCLGHLFMAAEALHVRSKHPQEHGQNQRQQQPQHFQLPVQCVDAFVVSGQLQIEHYINRRQQQKHVQRQQARKKRSSPLDNIDYVNNDSAAEPGDGESGSSVFFVDATTTTTTDSSGGTAGMDNDAAYPADSSNYNKANNDGNKNGEKEEKKPSREQQHHLVQLLQQQKQQQKGHHHLLHNRYNHDQNDDNNNNQQQQDQEQRHNHQKHKRHQGQQWQQPPDGGEAVPAAGEAQGRRSMLNATAHIQLMTIGLGQTYCMLLTSNGSTASASPDGDGGPFAAAALHTNIANNNNQQQQQQQRRQQQQAPPNTGSAAAAPSPPQRSPPPLSRATPAVSLLHTIEYVRLEHHYPIANAYQFGIPVVTQRCKCDCAGGDSVCPIDQYQYRNCTSGALCYRTYLSGQKNTGCLTSAKAELCCQIELNPYKDWLYQAIRLKQPNTVAVLRYRIFERENGPIRSGSSSARHPASNKSQRRIWGPFVTGAAGPTWTCTVDELVRIGLNQGATQFELYAGGIEPTASGTPRRDDDSFLGTTDGSNGAAGGGAYTDYDASDENDGGAVTDADRDVADQHRIEITAVGGRPHRQVEPGLYFYRVAGAGSDDGPGTVRAGNVSPGGTASPSSSPGFPARKLGGGWAAEPDSSGAAAGQRLRTGVLLNEQNEGSLDKLGWFRWVVPTATDTATTAGGGRSDQPLNHHQLQQQQGHLMPDAGSWSVRKGLEKITRAQHVIVEDCKAQRYASTMNAEQLVLRSFNNNNNYNGAVLRDELSHGAAVTGGDWPGWGPESPVDVVNIDLGTLVRDEPWVAGVRIRDREVLIQHAEGVPLSLFIRTESHPRLVRQAAQFANFSGTIQLDRESNRYLNLTFEGARGTLIGQVFSSPDSLSAMEVVFSVETGAGPTDGPPHFGTGPQLGDHLDDYQWGQQPPAQQEGGQLFRAIVAMPASVHSPKLVCVHPAGDLDAKVCHRLHYIAAPMKNYQLGVAAHRWQKGQSTECPGCNERGVDGLLASMDPRNWLDGLNTPTEVFTCLVELGLCVAGFLATIVIFSKCIVPLFRCVWSLSRPPRK